MLSQSIVFKFTCLILIIALVVAEILQHNNNNNNKMKSNSIVNYFNKNNKNGKIEYYPSSLQEIRVYNQPVDINPTIKDKFTNSFIILQKNVKKIVNNHQIFKVNKLPLNQHNNNNNNNNNNKVINVNIIDKKINNDIDTKIIIKKSKIIRYLSSYKGGASNNNDNNNYNQQKQQSSNKKKVLILMSDTGGGHRASAQAIDQAIQYNYPNKIDVEIMDLWTEYAPFPYNRFVPYYRFMAKRPLLWRLLYTYGLFTPTKKWTEFRSACTCYSKFKTAIENVNPDFVISVHPLTQLMPISIVKELNKKRIHENKLKIPFITIVTDLGSAHPTWFDKRVDAIYVPSEAVKKLAIKYGISKNKILFKGLPIRTSFGKPGLSKVITRKNLNLNLNDKTVLLMGGGDGVGGIDKIASQVINQLKQLNFNSQLIIVCGHNKKIYDKLKETYQITDKHLKVIVKGFVNNIDEFMIASDCLITKAGPGTIAEGMIRGLPMIISSYLPGQVRIIMYCL